MIIGSILSNPKYHDAVTGKLGAKAAEQAAKIQAKSLDESMDKTQALSDAYDPYSQAGLDAWSSLVEGSTLEGMEENLSNIYGSDLFTQSQDIANRQLQNQLASTGMRRSGTGLLEAANQPFQTALGIEGMLRGRQQGISDTGYGALNTQTGLGQSIAQMLVDQGKVRAGGVLGEAQSHAQGALNQYNALHNVGSSIMGMFGGGGGSDSNVEVATTGISPNSYFDQNSVGGGNTGNWVGGMNNAQNYGGQVGGGNTGGWLGTQGNQANQYGFQGSPVAAGTNWNDYTSFSSGY